MKCDTFCKHCHLLNNVKDSKGTRLVYVAEIDRAPILVNNLAILVSVVDLNIFPKPQFIFFFFLSGSKGGNFNNDCLFISCLMSQPTYLEIYVNVYENYFKCY